MATTHFSGPIALGTNSVETVTAAKTLTADDNGKVLVIGAAAGFAITLPAPVRGMRFKVVNGINLTGDATVVTNGGDNIIYGQIIAGGAAEAVIVASAEDTITFELGADAIGDFVDLVSDGTNWYVTGQVQVAAGMTTTAT